ncbi:family 16 glycosylhydrolase [Cystobacter ferrugineus]|uniref:Beta-glucanase n=2 Tax=Cystobacter ferrugineus TaxID=83449 RepID=A0A3S7UXA0_9BACT|nr:family 16 glycosylhydrolase [Cystobacter ferrugineus]AYM53343.1 endo-beta-13-14 glucanase (licheninase) [Cystobacter ferrugineus]
MAHDSKWKRMALALLLTACGSNGTPDGDDPGGDGNTGGGDPPGGQTPSGPPPPIQLGAPPSLEWREGYSAFNEPFDALDLGRWRPSDGWANSGDFNAGWRADHAVVTDGRLDLLLDTATCSTGGCSGRPYASGEVATQRYYGHGRYEVRMKPVRTPGTMTAFAITTGPAESTRSDAIDLAILGQNTKALRLNYITNGQRHDLGVNLPFDAADDFHTYGIEWTRDAIHWYVDDQRIHSETGHKGALPSVPGRALVNFWPGNPGSTASWMGRFTYPGSPLVVSVEHLRYSPAAPVELLESFETPEQAALWVRTVGPGASLTARQSNQGHQGKSLYLDYTTSATAYAYTARTFSEPQDWTGVRYLNFWFRGYQTGNRFRVELRDNGPSADAAERFESLFQDDFKGWKWVSVPLTAFTRRTDGQPTGAPEDGLTLSGVWGLAFQPLAGNNEAFIDDIELER